MFNYGSVTNAERFFFISFCENSLLFLICYMCTKHLLMEIKIEDIFKVPKKG